MRAVLIGVGESGSLVGRYLHGKGVSLVGAVSRTTGVGADLGDHLGLDRPLDVVISGDAPEVLRRARPDVVLVATASTVESQVEIIEACLRVGADVLSLAESGFFPTDGTRGTLQELDELAIGQGKSFFFGGVQDVFWYQNLVALTGAAQRLDTIAGETTCDLEDLGEAVVRSFPLGLPAGEFTTAMATEAGTADSPLFSMEPAVLAVLARLGLPVRERSTRIEPVVADRDVRSEVLGTTVSAGTTRGFAEVVEIVAGGVRVRARFLNLLMEEDERPRVTWRVGSEPELCSELRNFPGYEVTASNLVNRIPAVVAAAPGYRTVLDLPDAAYWAGPVRAT